MRRFSRLFLFAFAVVTIIYGYPEAGTCQSRNLIRIPDILGYTPLKCDFHTHTVFSDGNVWPPIRAKEAWMDGLDVLAITDHIEYQPHKNDINTDFNRSYEVAKPMADAYRITLIRGGEITRDMPPGHLNAIFLNDVSPLKTEKWQDAIKAAYDQDAFIFWNHPGWKGQQPDGIAKWYDEHTEIFDKGWVKGIEVVNAHEYYPEVHQWCLDKKLTMFANTDIHDPIQITFPINIEHRPMTIVLAKDKSAESVKEALLDRRTILYYKDWLIGEERFLGPLFSKSISIEPEELTLKAKQRNAIQIINTSSFDFELVLDGALEGYSLDESISLPAGKAAMLSIRCTSDKTSGKETIALPYRVENLKIRPNEGLPVKLEVSVVHTP